MKKLKKAALLQEYQDQLIKCVDQYPSLIKTIEWYKVTNGYDAHIVRHIFMKLTNDDVVETLAENLKKEWDILATSPLPQMFENEKYESLRYGGEENPVRFSVFLDELKRMWKLVNGCKWK